MDKKVKKSLTYVLFILIAVVLLYFSFRAVEWDAFVEALESCRWTLQPLFSPVSMLIP